MTSQSCSDTLGAAFVAMRLRFTRKPSCVDVASDA